jgi:hypothetical protein
MSEESTEIVLSRKGSHCLNCETTLNNEAYCPVCGQENTNRNISIWTLIQDFLGDYFSFDSKFFTTLIPLFISPGRVPQEFIEGHRVKHIPPFRILIFSSFVFFTIWGLTFDPEPNEERSMSTILRENVTTSADSLNQVLDSLQLTTINELQQTTADELDFNFNLGGDSSSGVTEKMKAFLGLLDQGVNLQEAVDSVAVDNSDLEKLVFTQVGKMYTSEQAALTKYFIGNLSLMILVIQPFFALLLKLIYIRRRKIHKFIGHLVFSFYFHAWLLVLFTIGLLIQTFWEEFPLTEFIIFPSLIYLFFALKKYYRQSWGKSFLKLFLVFLFYAGVIIPLFFILSMLTSFFFF